AVAGSSRRLGLSIRSPLSTESAPSSTVTNGDPQTHAGKVQTRMPSIPGMSVVSKMSAELQRRPFVEHAHPPSDGQQATGTKRVAGRGRPRGIEGPRRALLG